MTESQYSIGDRVRHYGTKGWGIIREVVQLPDGSIELRVDREDWMSPEDVVGWWSAARIDKHERASKNRNASVRAMTLIGDLRQLRELLRKADAAELSDEAVRQLAACEEAMRALKKTLS